jgi:nucleotide-binding universal stress UspA family protein
MTSTTPLSGARTGVDLVPIDHRAVLVPLDGSAQAERALGPPDWLADQLGAALHTVVVGYVDDTRWYSGYVRSLRDRWPVLVAVVEPLAALSAHGERHRQPLADPTAYVTGLLEVPELAGIDAEAHVAFDPLGPDEGLVDHLRDHPATLVATTSRLRTHLDRALHGSTASRIVHASPVPVLVQPAVKLAGAPTEGRP